MKLTLKDEYDFNEYFLINRNWIQKYKDLNNFNTISQILDNENNQFSYKGY